MSAMDEPGLLGEIHRVLDGDEGRERKAAGVASHKHHAHALDRQTVCL